MVYMAEMRRATPENLRAVGDRVRTRIADLVAAYGASDLEGTLSFFSPEIVFMPADRPATRGLDALRRHLERTFASGAELIALTKDYFATHEELAVQRGTYERRITQAEGPPIEQHGSYELIWRLQDDGEFRVTSWIFTRAESPLNGRRR
jgi:ketosteroid isomerase-like protein